jgi:hypothetical protein
MHRTNGIDMRKKSYRSSNDNSNKDPPKKNLEKSHIIYTSVKRNINTHETGLSIHETQ